MILSRRPSAASLYPLLIVAAAACAATLGHAAQYVVGAFSSAGYMHVAQQPLAELAALCLGLAALASMADVLRASKSDRADALLPALAALARIGVLRAAAIVAPLSLALFVAGEALEQHAAGGGRFDLSAAFGAHVATWVVIHVVIAVVISFAMVSAARFACMHARAARRAAIALLAFLRPRANPAALSPVAAVVAAPVPLRPDPLAASIANRPPPVAA